jgi:hypothetical protein
MEAEGFLGDMMGELAESQYSEQGGSVGMVEGRVQLTPDEIKDCMHEALSLLDNGSIPNKGFHKSFDFEALRVDRAKLVAFWYKEDYK